MHAFGGLAGEANLSLRADKNEDEIKALIKERRDVDKKDNDKARDVSKRIKKCIRDRKRMKRQEKVQKI